MSSQDDLGQGPVFSALVIDPEQMEVRGLRPLAFNDYESMANAEHAGP